MFCVDLPRLVPALSSVSRHSDNLRDASTRMVAEGFHFTSNAAQNLRVHIVLRTLSVFLFVPWVCLPQRQDEFRAGFLDGRKEKSQESDTKHGRIARTHTNKLPTFGGQLTKKLIDARE